MNVQFLLSGRSFLLVSMNSLRLHWQLPVVWSERRWRAIDKHPLKSVNVCSLLILQNAGLGYHGQFFLCFGYKSLHKFFPSFRLVSHTACCLNILCVLVFLTGTHSYHGRCPCLVTEVTIIWKWNCWSCFGLVCEGFFSNFFSYKGEVPIF